MSEQLAIDPTTVMFSRNVQTFPNHSNVFVSFSTNDGRSWKAKGITRHSDPDLAMIRINGYQYFVRRVGTTPR